MDCRQELGRVSLILNYNKMKYFYDFEFLEGTQQKRFLGVPYGKTPPTIDVISIGIVAEDGREFYEVSKDFNLKEAWNRFDWKVETMYGDARNIYPEGRRFKEYWLRENVLRPIFVDLFIKDRDLDKGMCLEPQNRKVIENKMTYSWLEKLIKKYGKTNKEIALGVQHFTHGVYAKDADGIGQGLIKDNDVQLYGYYSAYDHVAFCWLFGKMIDLPKGFPMYTVDLKQELDNKVNKIAKLHGTNYSLNELKSLPNYPEQTNEHNALADARWNKELYTFLNSL